MVVTISLGVQAIFTNFTTIVTFITGMFVELESVFMPFIIGFAIAYFLNPVIISIEKNKFMTNLKCDQKIKRRISMIIAYIFSLLLVTWFLNVLYPAINESFNSLKAAIPTSSEKFDAMITSMLTNIGVENEDTIIEITNTIKQFAQTLVSNFNIEDTNSILSFVGSILLNSTVTVASMLVDVILAIFISVYMLSGKEAFKEGSKKILFAYFKKDTSEAVVKNSIIVNDLFKNFIVGKTLDSFIVSILCFIGMTLIDAPFTIILSVIIGITNMIPYFGPFIGAVPVAIIVLIMDPQKILWVGIFILLLQQFDGAFIGPRILGDSTGMSSIWVIFSIIIGGAIAGPLGMFIGVPLVASIKHFVNEAIENKYNENMNDVMKINVEDNKKDNAEDDLDNDTKDNVKDDTKNNKKKNR